MNQLLSKLPRNTIASNFFPYASNLVNKNSPNIPINQNYMYLDKFKILDDDTYMNISLYRYNNNKNIDHYLLNMNSNHFSIKEMLINKKSLNYKLFYNNKQILELNNIDHNFLDLKYFYPKNINDIIYKIKYMEIQIDYIISK